ncbi:DUF4190 domain-containing protein [Plantactinospora sonchi]|uniref:DUF4190 domain-containing protein n=1 Tax=Plantactinospora sonchi TaxID=1544735 RepID=A0ABU7RSH4_9ACTN
MTSPNPADPTSGATPGAYGEPTSTPYGEPTSGAAPGAYGNPGAAPAPYGAVNPTPAWAPGYPPPYAGPRPTNGMAIASLVTGIVALFSCSLLGGVAVYLAKRAREEIRTKGEEGEGLATAGLVIGWIGVGLGVLTLVFLLLYFGVVGYAIFSSTNT